MPQPVSLRDIVTEMDIQSDEVQAYLDRRTGETTIVTSEGRRLVEVDVDPENLSAWQRETMPKVRQVLESEDYLPLPSQWDINEYRIMERFCLAVEDDANRDELLRAIRGRGAFRYFKNTIDRLGLRDEWHAYRDAAFAEIATRWLDANDIPYVNDLEERKSG